MKDEITLPNTTLKPKGHVSLELFDTQGNVVDKVEKDNFVHERLLEIIGKGNILGALGKSGYQIGNARELFNGLILTDYAAAPDPTNERFYKGNILGVAKKDSVYNDAMRGSYNSEESVIDDTYIKLVYDFGTATANGTFNSIYTAPVSSISESGGIVSDLPSIGYAGVGDAYTTLDYLWTVYRIKKGVLIHRVGNVITFYKDTGFPYKLLDGIEGFAGEKIAEYDLGLTATSFTYIKKTDEIVFNVDNVIYKAPYTDPTNYTKLFDPYTINSRRATHITYDNVREVLYVAYSSYMTTWDLNTFTELEYESEFNYSYMNMSIVDPDIRFHNLAYLEMENWVDITTGTRGGVNEVSYSNRSILREINDDVLAFRYHGSRDEYAKLYLNYWFFSRALLDAPVTKTAQNTMKITYEFTLPEMDF